MNVQQTMIAKKSAHRPTPFWFIITPDGDDTGIEHSRVSDVIAELMCIDTVSNEVYDTLRGQEGFDWSEEDRQDWIWRNCADIAKTLGYRINKVLR
jgi:hypothetical protein